MVKWNMTYILVNKQEDSKKIALREFLKEIFKREITLEELYTNPDIHNLEITDKLSIYRDWETDRKSVV